MKIRKFEKEDILQVLQLCREVRNHHREFLGGYFAEQDDEMEKVGFMQSLESNKIIALVAEEENEIQGYLLAERKFSPYLEKSNVVNVSNFGVKAGMRGNGIGRKLMDFLYDFCKNENIDEIRLGVFNKNTGACRFYEKYGFEPFEQRMNIMVRKECCRKNKC